MNLNDLKLLSPEIFLSLSSLFLLVLSLSKVDAKKIINLSIISLIITILLVCNLWFGWMFEPSTKNSLLGCDKISGAKVWCTCRYGKGYMNVKLVI